MTMVACAMLAFAAPASAQTPGQYCATVSGCEILDFVAGGYNMTAFVKYCKNSKLNVVPVFASAQFEYTSYIAIGNGSNSVPVHLQKIQPPVFDALNDDDCVNLP